MNNKTRLKELTDCILFKNTNLINYSNLTFFLDIIHLLNLTKKGICYNRNNYPN